MATRAMTVSQMVTRRTEAELRRRTLLLQRQEIEERSRTKRLDGSLAPLADGESAIQGAADAQVVIVIDARRAFLAEEINAWDVAIAAERASLENENDVQLGVAALKALTAAQTAMQRSTR